MSQFGTALRAVMRQPVSLALVVLLASGCTPEYNWRTWTPEGGGVQLLLPARPASMTRRIDLDGLAVEMTMHGARAGDASFTVAWVQLPASDEATRRHALDAMRAGMLRNIGAVEHRESARSVPVVDAFGAPAGSLAAVEVHASGSRPQPGTEMRAIFVARGARAWQVVAIGRALPQAQADTFLDSFALRAAP